ncbi:histidine phosphatase family protein [Pseudonocardia sp. NPDC049635]|uniref:histidine phosphatase family protein n=1 Tax=Pseudonocardia sp. NPDC049635 TaxID=3155506 RepID=UPI0033DA3538
MTLALVRHGRTAWNRERRLQGRTDIALDDHGRVQADAAGRLLARAPWTRLVCSPLVRAVETARIVGGHLGLPHVLDPALVERDFGAAEGMAVAAAAETWPDGDYPGSETWSELSARAHEALTRQLRRGGDTVVVAHGTVLRAGIEAIVGGRCPRLLNGQVVLLDGTTAQVVEG